MFPPVVPVFIASTRDIRHNPSFATSERGEAMGDEERELPSIGEIYETWLTTAEAAEILNMRQKSIGDAIRRGKLRGVKLGGLMRGEWRVDPASVAKFRKSVTGRPRKG